MKPTYLRKETGFSMIEVLVTLVILLSGLLGLAGLLTFGQQAEMESYQRSQALVILEDMVWRINANRKLAASYNNLTAGTGVTVTCPGTTIAEKDICAWDTELKGAAEQDSSSNKIGAMVGARGCVITTATDTYLVSVAWQGLNPTFAPPSGLDCGKNQYGGAAGETQRRVVSTSLRIANLTAP